MLSILYCEGEVRETPVGDAMEVLIRYVQVLLNFQGFLVIGFKFGRKIFSYGNGLRMKERRANRASETRSARAPRGVREQ